MNLPKLLHRFLGSRRLLLNFSWFPLRYCPVFAAAAFWLFLAVVSVLFVYKQKQRYLAFLPGRRNQRRIAPGWVFALQTQAGKARGMLLFWPLWERFTRWYWHLQPVPFAPHRLLLVRCTHYNGQDFHLPDGTHIGKGDIVLELHFRNQAFLELEAQASAWAHLQLIEQNLGALARWLKESDGPGAPLAIYGVTLLFRGAPRLGFALRKCRHKKLHASLERFFLMGLLVLYHRQGLKRLLRGTTYGTFAQEAWMSRQTLLKRYGSADASFLSGE